MRAVLLATIAAVIVHPLVMGIVFFIPDVIRQGSVVIRDAIAVGVVAILVSAAYVIALGLPAFLYLRRRALVRWWSMAVAGFITGSVPFAVWNWPRYSEGVSSGGWWYGSRVDFIVNGVPTIYGWLSHAQSSAIVGLFGVVSALTFWAVWTRLMRPNTAMDSDTARSPLSAPYGARHRER